MEDINELTRLRCMETDFEAARHLLLVPCPSPGTDMARVVSANAILRGENAKLREALAELGRINRTAEVLNPSMTMLRSELLAAEALR